MKITAFPPFLLARALCRLIASFIERYATANNFRRQPTRKLSTYANLLLLAHLFPGVRRSILR